ncbi:MAG TPA: DUF2807 domain-containing protein [Rhizomicrobium sp.]|jgi:hypothetical protein|nr:DUF2807 domain-containing protein [Rhizomicrobium sp.]
MRKHLGWIALGGFVMAAFLLWSAFRIGGGFDFGDLALRAAASRLPLCREMPAGQTASREIAWTGGDTVSISIPSTAQYRPGEGGDNVKVTGDAALIPHVVIVDDEIKLNCLPGPLKTERVAIVLPGRSFLRFNLAGLTTTVLNDLDQPELRFNIAGSSSVEATGRADSLRINGAGLSEAKLGGLAVKDAHLNLAGKSTVEVSVEDSLEVNSVGAATLTLVREPKSIKTNILGATRVIHRAQ